MRYLLAILPLLFTLSMFSCEPKDEIITSDPSAVLTFSADTVLFDTVFVSRGTITKRLKVYNKNKRAVRISEISLASAGASAYQITVNGVQKPILNNVDLRGGDSLYVLVKATINPTDNNQPFLVADSLIFKINGQLQNVKLVAYGQNAYFHRKEVIGSAVWKSDKPHVLLDTILVQEGATLTIEKGAAIYGSSKSVLLVNGRLLVEGTPEERVVFSGYRREQEYLTAPGQWEGIRILVKSANNSIKYADIKNTLYGLRIGNPGKPTTLVEGCAIQYAFLDGIIAFTSNVKVVNTLIHNCGQYGFGGLGGGNYEIIYSTIVSYKNPLLRETPLLTIADFIPGSEIKNMPTSLRLINSIVYSDNYRSDNEVLITPLTSATDISNNILRSEAYKEQFKSNENKLNVLPKFKAPDKADFRLDTLSPASGAAKYLPTVLQDIKGKTRSANKPDIGAFERLID